jgi:hypothetical protein
MATVLVVDGPDIGVLQEVDILRQPALANRTVVVIAARYCGENDPRATAIREWLRGFPHVVFESAATARFYHITREHPRIIMQRITPILDIIKREQKPVTSDLW